MDNKKITSTIALFLVFIGFLWWGISMLTSTLAASQKDGETIVYSLLLLACAGYALVSLLMLPRKKLP
jgi:bacteriorhodopsin